eukprot:TRINITY_DN5410_c0_g3_i1.p2 TRINITY_DN5410_c0_g3~~TRINITY_DN5410_c0_g3_i1.p2  ORF type:complete len:263 (-),score=19.17 TRINITY_DN5410_c0_g3_i1:1047-1835(-)
MGIQNGWFSKSEEVCSRINRRHKRWASTIYWVATFGMVTTFVVWNIWSNVSTERFDVHDTKRKYSKEQLQQIQQQQSQSFLIPDLHVPKLSPMITGLLVECNLIPYVVIDLRNKQEAALQELPQSMQTNSIQINVSNLGTVLESSQSWKQEFSHVKYPSHYDVLLFIGSSQLQLKYATALATGLGYQRVAILEEEISKHCKSIQAANKLRILDRNLSQSFSQILKRIWPHVSIYEDIHSQECSDIYQDLYYDIAQIIPTQPH